MCRDISMSEFYKPLNEGLTIKESGIHGIGIFATNDIPKGTRLGLSHMLVDYKSIYARGLNLDIIVINRHRSSATTWQTIQHL